MMRCALLDFAHIDWLPMRARDPFLELLHILWEKCKPTATPTPNKHTRNIRRQTFLLLRRGVQQNKAFVRP